MYQTIRYEKNGDIAIITVNRPEALKISFYSKSSS